MIKPFSEVALFEQGNSSDPFYATGSIASIGDDASFTAPLRNKDQIKLSFSVNNTVTMLPKSSSIYYFNTVAKQWNISTASVSDHIGPFDKFSFPSRWGTSPYSGSVSPLYTNGSLFTEDSKAFSSHGNPVVSGSSTVYTQVSAANTYSHSNSLLNDMLASSFNTSKILNKYIELETSNYTKSVQRNSAYMPASEETFTLNNQYPFLIEKAVVEIPFGFGSSWFQDRTATTNADFSGSRFNNKSLKDLYDRRFFDRGGPALTLSIFCKKRYGNGYILDLIASGTITHTEDEGLSVDVRDTPSNLVPYAGGYTGILTITSMGIETPAAVVSKGTNSTFTGSIPVKLTPANSNGLQVIFSQTGNWQSPARTPAEAKSFYENLFSNEFNVDEPTISNTYFVPTDIDPFGRGMTGFAPSGGSIFGGEFATGQTSFFDTRRIKNYFYISSSIKRQEVVTKINNLIDQYYIAYPSNVPYIIRTTNVNFSNSNASPYLLNPGEQLTLAISKTRPAVTGVAYNILSASVTPGSPNFADLGVGNLINYANFTGSNPTGGHDVQLITGSINITFYGSYVRENKEYVP